MGITHPARGPAPSSNRAQFDQLQFRIRIGIVTSLAIVAPFVPQIGDNRVIVAASLGLVALPLHFVVRWVTGNPNPTGWLDLIAVSAATITVIIEPKAFVPAFFFQSIHLIGAIPFLTTRWSHLLASASILSMIAVAIVLPVDPVAVPMLIIAIVLLPAVFLGTTRKRLKDHATTERVASIAYSLPTVLWEADQSTGDMLSVFGAPERVLSTSVRHLLGNGYARRINSNDRDAFDRRFSAGDRSALTYRFHADDGGARWLTDQVEEVESRGRKVLRGLTIDVTELHRAQESAVRQSEIVERMSAATLVIAGEGPLEEALILSASDPLGDLLGDPSSVIGLPFGEVLPVLASQPWLIEGIQKLDSVQTVHSGPREVYRQGVGSVVVEVQLFSMQDQTTALIIENVTERERAHETIRHQALHDPLTNLPNRTALMEQLEGFLHRSESFTFALLDLNRFKAVNDTLGHLTGDQLLQIVARRLQNAVDSNDVVARLGGDEFAIILSHEPHPATSGRMDRIINACRDRVAIEGSSISVGVSIGLVSAPHDGSDPETLLRLADVAMYEAKRSRNSVRVFEAEPETSPKRLELMAELEDAFRSGQFVPFFQPKCETTTGKVVGVEALARWQHPRNGILAPAEFMELIAVSGRLDDLLDSILWQSVQAITQMPEHLHVAINLSAVNLLQSDITTTFQRVIETSSIAPSRLTVELTESEFMDNTGRVEASLRELSALGLGIAVDDFGTGYSSLSHLRNLPLTELKVDRQFVSSMVNSPADRVVVQALVSLAHDLGLTLTAEGVEDEATHRVLREMGCDTIQGYYFGRPVPIAEFNHRLGQGNDFTPSEATSASLSDCPDP